MRQQAGRTANASRSSSSPKGLAACLGQVDEAIAHFQQALELKPDDAKIRRNLEAARRSGK